MEFHEIENQARLGEPLGERRYPSHRTAYASLCYLYKLYREGAVPKEQAAREKAQIRRDFEADCHEEARQRAVYAQYQEAIRLAGTRKSGILLALQAGKPSEEILPLALECIAAMTGEDAFPRLCQKAGERAKKEEIDHEDHR